MEWFVRIFHQGLNPCSNGICSLTGWSMQQKAATRAGLNPCSNGICSLTLPLTAVVTTRPGLNPCSNGICSLTWECILIIRSVHPMVLILVLMEYALWQALQRWRCGGWNVLILVLMEYALWHGTRYRHVYHWCRLNPCSNGICSLTIFVDILS